MHTLMSPRNTEDKLCHGLEFEKEIKRDQKSQTVRHGSKAYPTKKTHYKNIA